MNDERTRRAQDWREKRRFQAWDLKQKEWKQKDIAEALGVSEGAVSQWVTKAEREGVEALRGHKGGGPKPRLSQEQVADLPVLLAQGAEHFGFRGSVWTRKRVASVVRQVYGVSYSPSQIGRLLAAIGWSSQKPIERASQRDEAAIEHWREDTWPQLQKKPRKKEGR